MKRFFLFILLGFACAQTLQAQDADSLKFSPVHIGVLLQGNYSGESMYIAEFKMSAYPDLGVEVGTFVDYHLTRDLFIEVQLLVALQNGTYVATDYDPGFLFWNQRKLSNLADMSLIGMDIPLYLSGQLAIGTGHLRLGAGPYTHFTFDSWSPGDRDFVTPYKRIVSEDEATGMPRYALSDTHAGFGMYVGYEFESGLQFNLGAKYSILDIINYESERSHAHPYKLTFGAGWRF